jgi:hypothetical protein
LNPINAIFKKGKYKNDARKEQIKGKKLKMMKKQMKKS